MNHVDVSDMIGDHLAVPQVSFCPCPLLKQQLDLIDPFLYNNSTALYTSTIQIVGQHLILHCNQCILN